MQNCPLTGKSCDALKRFPITEIVEDKHVTVNLCHRCAYYCFHDEHFFSSKQSNEVSPTIMLKTMMEFMQFLQEGKDKCPNCGFGLKEIRRAGKVGCVRCREHFGQHIEKILSKTENMSAQEIFKKEIRRIKYQLNEAKNRAIKDFWKSIHIALNAAVSEERYEDAAAIKNIIGEMESTMVKKEELQNSLKEVQQENPEEIDNIMDSITTVLNVLIAKIK